MLPVLWLDLFVAKEYALRFGFSLLIDYVHFLEQLCSKYPTISNGKFSLEEDSVTYSCNEGYFMPTQNVTQMTILCSCRWAEDLELVENCTSE